ncbi:MAG: glycosyltransferase [Rhizobiales bacterium]|nr:glycosyltransferase [Hyphomicrobiales bacterium]
MAERVNLSSKGPVAIFLSALSGGGAERAMVNLANRFAELGLETHMVLGRREGPYLELLDPRVKIFDLGVKRMMKSLAPLNDYMRLEKPAVLMPALAHTHIIAIVGKLLYRWPTRLVLSVQNTPTANAGKSALWIERYWPLFVRTVYRFTDSVVAISQGVAEDLRQLTGGKLHPTVINNPVVTPHFYAQVSKTIEHKWFDKSTAPVLIAVGRLNVQKDYPTMLAAFALLKKRRDARLLILGDGELRAELENMVRELGLKDDVEFVGFVSNPYAWMKAADLFVLTSRWEGLANVIAEALACGTPVVSTDCPSGPAEILKNGEFGILAPMADPAALAAAMDQALSTSWDKSMLMMRGNDFGIDAIADAYLKILLPPQTQTN